jgi:SAM-dependent methyltransferase
LRCPVCRAGRPFSLRAEAGDGEIRSGSLSCAQCGHVAAIRDGIVDLMHDPPVFVRREAEGLVRFAQVMRDDGWTREVIMKLPYIDDGYWFAHASLMEQTLATVPFQAGDTILDIGSNTCWAAATFAQRGLAATALDIADTEMQGLRTADWHFEDKGVYFERVLGMMFDLPFAHSSFKYVWACEVLHHNHRANLARTYREIHRVLEPGGQLIVCNEPLRTVRTPKLRPGREVADFEGREHAYMRVSYTHLARLAGFDVDVHGPFYHGIFQPGGIGLSDQMSMTQILRVSAVMGVRKSDWLKRAALAAYAYVLGGTALHMICTKRAD